MFSRWGTFVYRQRRIVALVAVVVAVAASTLATQAAGQLSSGGWLDPRSESAQVSDRLEAEFGTGRSSLVTLFRTTTGANASSPEFQRAIANSVRTLRDDPRVAGIIGYAETGADRFISRADDAAYIVTSLTMSNEESVSIIDELEAQIDPPVGYSVQTTGFGPVQRDNTRQSEEDLKRAETVSLPVVAIVLIAVFASLIAAGLPLFVAGLAIPSALALVYLVAQRVEMSIYVLNIATMLGLALAIDYSLFLTSRFREELARGRTVAEAVERTVATAGKAVTFSGIAVAIGLSGLLWFPATALSSIGIAGVLVVLCSVIFSITFLPAVLGMLGPRVNALSLRGLLIRLGLRGDDPTARHSRWEAVARGVMRRPILVLVPTLAFLLLLGSPFLRLVEGVPDATVNPPGLPSRDAWVALQAEFQPGETTPIIVLANVPQGAVTERTVAAVRQLTTTLSDLDGVIRVEGPFDLHDPVSGAVLPAAQVARLFEAPAGALPPELAAGIGKLRETYIRDGVIRLDAISPIPSTTPAGGTVVKAVRAAMLPAEVAGLEVGGSAAVGVDFLAGQDERLPLAVGTTLLASAVILFLLFGSIAIPIKAVLMTLLSLSASFGALVWIFQEGNLKEILHFEPLGYTVAGNPVIMFATLIGLSMDYEVLLLSRIQEAWRRTGDNTASVAEGLARTASVITGAALIMVTVFAAFALADTLTIKSIGVGMAVAVLLDATVVRVLLVPATMRLLGRWNWWAPGPLGRLADRVGFSHVEVEGN